MESLSRYSSRSNPFSRSQSENYPKAPPNSPISILEEIERVKEVTFFCCNPNELRWVESEYQEMLREEGAELGIYLNDLVDEKLELIENGNDLSWTCSDYEEFDHNWRFCPNCSKGFSQINSQGMGGGLQNEEESSDGICERSDNSDWCGSNCKEESSDSDD